MPGVAEKAMISIENIRFPSALLEIGGSRSQRDIERVKKVPPGLWQLGALNGDPILEGLCYNGH